MVVLRPIAGSTHPQHNWIDYCMGWGVVSNYIVKFIVVINMSHLLSRWKGNRNDSDPPI